MFSSDGDQVKDKYFTANETKINQTQEKLWNNMVEIASFVLFGGVLGHLSSSDQAAESDHSQSSGYQVLENVEKNRE